MGRPFDFTVRGQRRRGHLFIPAGSGRHPVVILAHGLGGVASSLAAQVAGLTAAGLAAVTFDYGHFGASDGQPRQLFSIRGQLDDIAAALATARARPEVDPDRVALWGTSFGAAHVLTLAARRAAIHAVVAQNPVVDLAAMSWRTLRQAPLRRSARLLVAAARDQLAGLVGRAAEVPLVGTVGSAAAVAVDAPERVLAALGAQWAPGTGDAPAMRNTLAPRFMLTCSRYRPIAHVHRIAVPVHYTICRRDTVAPPELAWRAARRTPRARVHEIDADHVGIYLAPHLGPVLAQQCDFLARTLRAAGGSG